MVIYAWGELKYWCVIANVRFIDGAYEKIHHIFSGLVHKAKLEASTKKESSFVGIYASNSPGMFISC